MKKLIITIIMTASILLQASQNNFQELFTAIQDGNVKQVRKLIFYNATNPTITNNEGVSALEYAKNLSNDENSKLHSTYKIIYNLLKKVHEQNQEEVSLLIDEIPQELSIHDIPTPTYQDFNKFIKNYDLFQAINNCDIDQVKEIIRNNNYDFTDITITPSEIVSMLAKEAWDKGEIETWKSYRQIFNLLIPIEAKYFSSDFFEDIEKDAMS